MPDVKCPNGHKLNVPDAYLGQEVRCSVCNVTFVAPTTGLDAAAAAPGPGPSPVTSTIPASSPGEVAAATPQVAVGQESVAARHRNRSLSGFLGFLDSEKIGKPLLFFGLILVIFSRGCDGLGARWANRLRAKASSEPQKFDQRTQRMVRGKDSAEATKVRQSRDKEKEGLQNRWADMADSAGNARANHSMWAFYYHCGFLFGSLTLSFGLLVVGFNGTGSERTICLIMIAIITFSIYIAGAPWLEGTAATMLGGG